MVEETFHLNMEKDTQEIIKENLPESHDGSLDCYRQIILCFSLELLQMEQETCEQNTGKHTQEMLTGLNRMENSLEFNKLFMTLIDLKKERNVPKIKTRHKGCKPEINSVKI